MSMEVFAYQYAALLHEPSITSDPKPDALIGSRPATGSNRIKSLPQAQRMKRFYRHYIHLLLITISLTFSLSSSVLAVISPGTRGAAVTSLQLNLKNAGYDPGPIDGIYGGTTEYAVRRFQQDRGLIVDGIVGPATEAALTGAVPIRTPRPLPPRAPIVVQQKVVELQQLLANQRCYNGPIDGIYGPGTSAAVLRAQRNYGLVADGIPGPATIAALRSARCRCF
ncbi:MAG: peptidoglycan-binding protein [Leptolyngbyaceae bacterium]|nr:peptidoglycan-binding protein [Leptolyngbyaceae bacterium]